jgi:hypothetical protein
MSEVFGAYLNQVRKTKASITEMTPDEWQNVIDYASKTGQCIKISGKDAITVDGVAMSYDHLVEGLMAIEAADEYSANRMSIY